jgi:hypothetical protein
VIDVLKHILATILGALALSLMVGAEPSKALEELKVYRGVLVLEGKIVPGDYDKLRNFLGTKSTFDKISGGVFLASPGGDMAEAMKIGRLIRELRLSTDAPSGPPSGSPKFGESLIKPNNLVDPNVNYRCASACFFIYVSGIYRNLSWAGRLGIHRPSQPESVLKKLSSNEVIELNGRVRKEIDNYLREMNVRIKYVDLMFSVPPTEIRWINQDELDSDLQGFIPGLKDLVDAKCDPRTTIDPSDKEKIVSVAAKSSSEIDKCRMQVQARLRAELPIEAWHNIFGGN